MINLVSRAPHSIHSIMGDLYTKHSGLLTGPFSNFHPETAIQYGARWAADNGCFLPGYNPDRIVSMLKRYSGLPNCRWVVAPDVVQDAGATLLMLSSWLPTYREYGFPVALAIQNGIEHYTIPYDSLACIFIGGNDEFKYSRIVQGIVLEALKRGLWVHNGRVNTPQRIMYSRALGCHSFDGTHFTRVPSDTLKYLPYQLLNPSIAGQVYKSYQKPKLITNNNQMELAI